MTTEKGAKGQEIRTLIGGGGLDPNAIHDNVAGEIAAIAPKGVPVNADLIVIEDSAAGNAKKSVLLGNLPGGGATFIGLVDTPPGYVGEGYRDARVNAAENAVEFHGYSNVRTVGAAGCDFTQLSACMAAIAGLGPAANNRFLVKVYGRINDNATINALSYVDVIGYEADVIVLNNGNINGVDFVNVVECYWENITIRRQGVLGGGQTYAATFSGTTDRSCRIGRGCRFIHEDTGGVGGSRGILIDGADPTGYFYGEASLNGGGNCWGIFMLGDCNPIGDFIGLGGGTSYGRGILIGLDATDTCIPEGNFWGYGRGSGNYGTGIVLYGNSAPKGNFYGYSANVGTYAYGISISNWGNNNRRPEGLFVGQGRSTSTNSMGVSISEGANPRGTFIGTGGLGNDCHGIYSTTSSAPEGVFYGHPGPFGTNCYAVVLQDATALSGYIIAEPIKFGESWDYDDLNNGRFTPACVAGHPYQLYSIEVMIQVGNPGVTLDLGTAIGGNQIAANIDIGAVGRQCFTFNRVEQAAGAFMYATPSAPINDGDVQVIYTVVTRYNNGHGVFMKTTGHTRVTGGHFLGNGEGSGLWMEPEAAANKQWIIKDVIIETLDPTNEYAIAVAGGGLTDAPIYDCILIGRISGVVSYEGNNIGYPTMAIGEKRVFKKVINYNDASPLALIDVADGYCVEDLWVEVTTTWDGAGATLDIGDGGNNSGFMANADINLAAGGYYGFEVDERGAYLWDAANSHTRDKIYTGNDTIDAFIVPGGGATQGEAVVYCKITRIF